MNKLKSRPVESKALTDEASRKVEVRRGQVALALSSSMNSLVVGVGQCSTNARDVEITRIEANKIREVGLILPGVLLMQRQNHRKPRSPRQDGSVPWQGMDTTHPEQALMLHQDTINLGTPICSELLTEDQIDKYADGLSMAWVGARNTDASFPLRLATTRPDLPLGLKNDTDGSHERVNQTLELLKRDCWNSIAPTFLVERGGSTITTPELWEDRILGLLDETGGEFMLDLAHGTEQAHDPTQKFQKSAEAEKRALDHYISIGERTGIWAKGLLIEASDAPSDTDPNMPFQIALDGIRHIAQSMRVTGAPDILEDNHA